MLPDSAPGLWQAFSPAGRLLAALLSSALVAAFSALPAAAFAIGLALAAVVLGATPWSALRPRLLAVNFFLLFMWLVVPFTTSWEQVGHFSPAGARLCLLITLKANGIVLFFTAFLTSMSPYALGSALVRLRCPAKLAWLFLLLERNAHLLRQEWTVITDAARLRGFAPASSLRCWKAFAALLALWFYRTWTRATTLREALLLRGYNGEIPFAVTGGSLPSWLLLLPLVLLLLPLFLFQLP